jgi:hypothetical protein
LYPPTILVFPPVIVGGPGGEGGEEFENMAKLELFGCENVPNDGGFPEREKLIIYFYFRVKLYDGSSTPRGNRLVLFFEAASRVQCVLIQAHMCLYTGLERVTSPFASELFARSNTCMIFKFSSSI